jgi:hypothetical protein
MGFAPADASPESDERESSAWVGRSLRVAGGGHGVGTRRGPSFALFPKRARDVRSARRCPAGAALSRPLQVDPSNLCCPPCHLLRVRPGDAQGGEAQTLVEGVDAPLLAGSRSPTSGHGVPRTGRTHRQQSRSAHGCEGGADDDHAHGHLGRRLASAAPTAGVHSLDWLILTAVALRLGAACGAVWESARGETAPHGPTRAEAIYTSSGARQARGLGVDSRERDPGGEHAATDQRHAGRDDWL